VIKSKFSVLCILFSAILLLQACAAVLNPKNQTVVLNTSDPNAIVLINGEKVGQGAIIETRLRRDKLERQIQVDAPGYKTANYCTMQSRRSWLCYFTGFPFIWVMVMDEGKKSFNFPKAIKTPPLIRLNNHTEKLKHISLDKIVFETDSSFQENEIEYKKFCKKSPDSLLKFKKRKRYYFSNDNLRSVKQDYVYYDSFRTALKKAGYIDTVNYIFKTYEDNLKLNLSVKRLNMITVISPAETDFLFAQADMQWELTDVFGQTIKVITLQSKSGQYCTSYYNDNQETVRRKVISDLLENSFYQLINDPGAASILEKSPAVENESTLTINVPTAIVDSTIDLKYACVTIKTKEKTGSGFVINNEGYILTNYHLIATKNPDPQNEILVITYNGESIKATIIRSSPANDLVLLKVEKQFSKSFQFPESKNYQFGDAVYAFGTSGIKPLSQSLSKGTLASDRKVYASQLIQANININKEYDGAPVIAIDGKTLTGMIIGKLSGENVEGIAFGIPAYKIKEYLKLGYK
jgi:S1-C subfamily serine protease